MAFLSPPNWGLDPLSRFIDILRDNQFATFNNMRDQITNLIRIDSIIYKSLSNHIDPDPAHPLSFLIRSHSVLRSSISITMSCQIYEAQPALRNSIELAAYAFYIWKNPNSWRVWAERDDSNESRKAALKEFRNDNIKKCLKENNAAMADIYISLYERFLTLGAHPNAAGILTGMRISHEKSMTVINTNYTQNDESLIKGAIKLNLQAGIFIYECFSQIYQNRAIADGLLISVDELKKIC